MNRIYILLTLLVLSGCSEAHRQQRQEIISEMRKARIEGFERVKIKGLDCLISGFHSAQTVTCDWGNKDNTQQKEGMK